MQAEIRITATDARITTDVTPHGRTVGIALDDWNKLPEPLYLRVRRQMVGFGNSVMELDESEHGAIVALAKQIEYANRRPNPYRRFGRAGKLPGKW